jgi:hypothetical protein
MGSERETQAKILSLVDTISVQVAKTNADVSALRSEFSELREGVSELRRDVTGLRHEVRSGFDRLDRRIAPLER